MAELSVIVPTRDRPVDLRRCLDALRAQDLESSRMEVVVVDDGSRDEVAPVVAEAGAGFPFAVRCERQAPLGLNPARDRGAAIAGSELLAFLDDDAVPSPGWAAAMLGAFGEAGCAGVAGRVELGLEAPAPSWLDGRRSYLAELDLGSARRWLTPDDPVPVGANCGVRRPELERVGGFRLGLDRVGDSLVSAGDTELFRRLRDAGGRFLYEPRAHVVHRVAAERLTLDYFERRYRAQGVSDELLLTLRGASPTISRRLALRWHLARAAPILVKGLALGRGAASARLWASYWSGRVDAIGAEPGKIEPR